MTTLSIDSLTIDPSGSENGLVVRNIPSGVQQTEITDGYGNILGTANNPLVVNSSSSPRTAKTFYALNQTVPYMSSGMMVLTPTTDYVAGTPGTSFGVTSGKILRIQSIFILFSSQFSAQIRISNSGAVTTSTIVTTNYINDPLSPMIFIDGLELSGNMEIGISMQQYLSPGATTDIFIIGYEY